MTDLTQFDGTSKALEPSSAFKATGYVPEENITDEQMLADWQFIEQVHAGSAWWIGDWLNRAENRKQQWGASIYDEAIALSGFEYATLSTYKWMAARINFSNRLEKLSIKHHLAVAKYEPDQQRFLLEKAKELHISAIRFREQIPVLLGIVTIEEEKPQYRYDHSKPAYCKYCYDTHNNWTREEDAWECGYCGSRTADEFMQIEGESPSSQQEAFYQKYGPTLDVIHNADLPATWEYRDRKSTPLPMPTLEPEDGPIYGSVDTLGPNIPREVTSSYSPPTPYTPLWQQVPDMIREQRRIEAQERIADLRENGAQLPTGQYSCLVVDPPWPMQKIERDVRPNQVEFDYPTMDEEELKAFPLPDLAADDCHLYLWTTQKHLPLALRLAEHWGFKYQCLLTWVKNVGFTPYSWMYSTEHVLFCTKGNLPLLRLGKRLDFETMETGFKANVREHSRKPDVFYNLVREVSPGPRLDVFSRERREGFDQYGNEVEKYVAAR